MAIDTRHMDRIPVAPEPVIEVSRAPKATVEPAASAPTTPSSGDVKAAVQAMQAAINSGPNPAFTLDYLSGLSVVTVRSNVTGEVVYQLPDTRAVELARLMKDGASLQSLGLVNTQA